MKTRQKVINLTLPVTAMNLFHTVFMLLANYVHY